MKKKVVIWICLLISALLISCNDAIDVPTTSQTASHSEIGSETPSAIESETETVLTETGSETQMELPTETESETQTELPTEEPTEEINLSWDEMTWHQIVVRSEDYMGAEKLDKEFNGPHTDLSKWFVDYNGEKLQRIFDKEYSLGPAICGDIIFYNTEETDVQLILKTMLDAMIQPLMEEDENRLYVITKYELTEQPLKEINENVWLIREISGYYAFEGEDGGVTMEEALEFETDIKEGMIRFMGEGSASSRQYLLLKQGSVYRLQKASDMGGYGVEIE